MSRTISFLAVAACLFGAAANQAAAAHGCGAFVDPAALGQQAEAVIQGDQIVISRTASFMVCEARVKTETRTKTVTNDDGTTREVAYSVEVPYTICKPVWNSVQFRQPLETTEVYDMQGAQLKGDKLAAALKELRTIVFANRKVPKYYLSIYKPDTLLVVQNFAAYASVAPVAGFVPPPPPGDVPPAPAPAPVPAPAPAPRPTPAPPIEVPDDAPQVAQRGMEPLVSLAKSAGGKLSLRSYVKNVDSQTAYRELEEEGVTRKAPVEIKTESIVDVERTIPQAAVKVYRADKKPLAAADLAKALESDRCVLVSTDGHDVTADYLKIVKPETLIIVTPIPAPPMPMVVPAAPAPLPAAPGAAPPPPKA
jgi:hypothetical protein